MNEWELIDSTAVPDSGGFMRLMRRGKELVIRVDGRQLMSTRMHGSEDALADLACDQLERRRGIEPAPRILIGGMGIGGAALAFASKDAISNFFGSVTVMTDRPFEIGQAQFSNYFTFVLF